MASMLPSPGQREASHLREVGRELVENGAGIKIGKQADTAADDGFVAMRRPGETSARFENDTLDRGKKKVRWLGPRRLKARGAQLFL